MARPIVQANVSERLRELDTRHAFVSCQRPKYPYQASSSVPLCSVTSRCSCLSSCARNPTLRDQHCVFKPELRREPFAVHMNMRRFVGFVTEEVEIVGSRSASQSA